MAVESPNFEVESSPQFIALQAQYAVVVEKLAALESLVAEQRAEIERLRGDDGPPAPLVKKKPSWVKANRPARTGEPRKKRSSPCVRKLDIPTRFVEHAVDNCPDCGRKLADGKVHSTRQVIDIPDVPVEVTEHRMIGRWCGVCKKRHVASPDLSALVLGKNRVGVRLMSLIVQLHERCRTSYRDIQSFLKSVYGATLSVGELVRIVGVAAERGRSEVARIIESLRSSTFVHADETGWRCDGVNGYIWSFCTKAACAYVYKKSRGHEVPEGVLGSDFRGVMATDFYGGYNYHLGEHQRCWVHFLRDLKQLSELYPNEQRTLEWIPAVYALWNEAREFQGKTKRERVQARRRFQHRLVALGKKANRKGLPERVLGMRCEKYANELFTFITSPEVPPDNNAAERAIRPAVIARKVSGGTRSDNATEHRMILMSLIATWRRRGLDPFEQCGRLLRGEAAAQFYLHGP